MDEDKSFHRFLFTEDLYLVHEETNIAPKGEEASKHEMVAPAEAMSETCIVLASQEKSDHPTLLNILKAINLHEVDFSEELAFQSGHLYYIVFGAGQGENKYRIEEREGKKILYSDALELLDGDKTLKRKLWEQLQLMFPG